MADPRILIVRLGSLGDIVHTFPAVAALRESFTAAEMVWLTHSRWETLVESSSLASQIWTTDTQSVKSILEIVGRIRRAPFDFAIDYQGLWKSAALPFLGGVPRRIGFSSQCAREGGASLLYTEKVDTAAPHVADQNGELSRRVGAYHAVAPVTLKISAEAQTFVRKFLRGFSAERYIVLCPGGGWRSKCWPTERFGRLCHEIRQRLALRCVVNYGPGEEDLVAAVHAASQEADPIPYNSDIPQLMALLRDAQCVVGGDTGPLHLAAALRVPVVALFGPTDPARNGPYPLQDNITLRSTNAPRNHRRNKQTDPSMLALSVEEVFEAVRLRRGTGQ